MRSLETSPAWVVPKSAWEKRGTAGRR